MTQAEPIQSIAKTPIDNDTLNRMQFIADSWADDTIARLVDTWAPPPPQLLSGTNETASVESLAALTAPWKPNWDALKQVTKEVFPRWQSNQSLWNWDKAGAGIVGPIQSPIAQYVSRATPPLPDWADPDKIARAEALFMEHGVLSVTVLFCASLPECYVVPDLAAVLQTTGQLTNNAEHRIRATGAMIFPVMMRGGLTTADGGGLAQIFKVRLIHATIRNLILRRPPGDLLLALANDAESDVGIIPPLPQLNTSTDWNQALFARGWSTKECGLPCNQEELAYTLLTFSYVFLRSMRILGVGFAPKDEEAYLHGWNVVGHYLGIEPGLMVHTMADAEKLFCLMQARGREDLLKKPQIADARPQLGQALISAMRSAIPFAVFKPFPLLLTRHLCGPTNSRELGLTGSVSWISQALFSLLLLIARFIDAVARVFSPQFSIARFLTRLMGYRFLTTLLMDQTRKLKLPDGLQGATAPLLESWATDRAAPAWLNRLEDAMTTHGHWGKRDTQVPGSAP